MLGVGLGVDTARQLTVAQVQALAQAGCGFVCRYVSGTPGSTLTRAEAVAISQAGLGIVSVFETLGDHLSYFAAAQGTTDARRAVAAASVAGQRGGHIFTAVDFDARAGDLPAIVQYLAAFAEGIAPQYLAGVYGSRRLDGLGYPLWQTMAWSGGVVSGKARIVQALAEVSYAGVTPVDIDVAMTPLHDLGWHLG
jgi:hypothetical protein